MKPVSLKKVSRGEAASLQEMVNVYCAYIEANITTQLTFSFYDQILECDILQQLFILLRKKIEGNADHFTVSLAPSEAVVLVYALTYCNATTNEYAMMVIKKFTNLIDADLKNRITAKPVQPQKLLL